MATAIAALSLRKVFAHVPNLERYWDSSARIAQLSGWVASLIRFPHRKIKPEEAYTFGLFRDCGIPVLMAMYADNYDILDAANNEKEIPFTRIESDELTVDHAMIGAMLAKEWHLPIDFQAAIEGHHNIDTLRGLNSHIAPDVSRYFIAIAQLSEYLLQRLTGLNKTCEWEKLGKECLTVLGIKETDVDSLCDGARDKNLHTEPAF